MRFPKSLWFLWIASAICLAIDYARGTPHGALLVAAGGALAFNLSLAVGAVHRTERGEKVAVLLAAVSAVLFACISSALGTVGAQVVALLLLADIERACELPPARTYDHARSAVTCALGVALTLGAYIRGGYSPRDVLPAGLAVVGYALSRVRSTHRAAKFLTPRANGVVLCLLGLETLCANRGPAPVAVVVLTMLTLATVEFFRAPRRADTSSAAAGTSSASETSIA